MLGRCLRLSFLALATLTAACSTEPGAAPSADAPTYKVAFDTTKGRIVVEVHRDWAPHGAARLAELVRSRFYDDIGIFRVVPRFVAQFGISGDPAVTAAWKTKTIPDDPVKQSNKRGYVTFASMMRPNTRGTHLFINLKDNTSLDGMGFPPIGQVVEGMNVVDELYAGYGEGAPNGKGPDQMRLEAEGNAYLQKEFPKLDYIRTARFVE